MKFSLKATVLPLLTLGAGGLLLVLQCWLRASAGQQGLYPSGHPALILGYILLVLFLVALFLCVRPLTPIGSYKQLFPAGLVRAIGCGAAAIGILYAGIGSLSLGGIWSVLVVLLALVSAACLGMVGYCRYTGTRPNGWAQMLIVVFLMVDLILRTRSWSSAPQTITYFYPLLASLFLMLTAFYHARLNVLKKGRRRFLFASQCALFLCCGALCMDDTVYYLCMGIWAACDLCTLSNPHRKREPVQESAL